MPSAFLSCAGTPLRRRRCLIRPGGWLFCPDHAVQWSVSLGEPVGDDERQAVVRVRLHVVRAVSERQEVPRYLRRGLPVAGDDERGHGGSSGSWIARTCGQSGATTYGRAASTYAWFMIRLNVCSPGGTLMSPCHIDTAPVMNAHTEPAAGAAFAGPVMSYPAPNDHSDPSGVPSCAAMTGLSGRTIRFPNAAAPYAAVLTWIVPW